MSRRKMIIDDYDAGRKYPEDEEQQSHYPSKYDPKKKSSLFDDDYVPPKKPVIKKKQQLFDEDDDEDGWQVFDEDTERKLSNTKRSNSIVKNTTPEEQGKIFFNNYVEVEILGRGSFGTAYKVLNLSDNKHYVLKEIEVENDSVENEIEMLEILKDNCHTYFACFVESHLTDDYFYIVMEYLKDYVSLTVKY